ncbi:hypothetical protein G6011_04708 [Alternaria panax]|uniref:Myb-like DNA-binding domain-containing protein n=1 Tax=Alternaria panax TaxID=48097 RepID=A0AAD4IH12_9PLEO|nr:hypothetical protein G6011_04708 [Alternaria panax]
MPSEAENIKYLYLVLTNDGDPIIDWDAVSAALDLKKGAVTKRWSRLKQAMKKNEAPGGTTYQFLWLCVKHHTRTQPPNWNEIAAKANTTSGAASKRYSRMKKVFEENETAPTSPIKNTPVKSRNTPNFTAKKPDKTTTSSADGVEDSQTTPTTKRKRVPPKNKVAPTEGEAKFKPDPEDEDDQEEFVESKLKRPKVVKKDIKVTPRPKPKPKPKPKGIIKKEETSEDGEDLFFDAQEGFTSLDETGYVDHDSYVVHDRKPANPTESQHLDQRTEGVSAQPADSLDLSDDLN